MANSIDRRIWTREETLAFLHAYNARKDEFQHARKRKHAMQNVLEDLISSNALQNSATIEQLNSKLKNLLRAFKAAEDNGRRTGATPIEAPFQELMEEIFGSMPIISCTHSLNVRGALVTALPVNQLQNEEDLFEERRKDKEHSSSVGKITRQGRKTTYRERKMLMKENYLKEKIKLLKEAEENKERRFEEVMRLKTEHHKEKMDILRKITGEYLN